MTAIGLLFFSFISFLASSHALDVSGKVAWNSDCPGFDALRSPRVVLDNGRIKGSVTRDGSFLIPKVPFGTYVLSVVSSSHSFDQFRIDVLEDQVEVRPYTMGTPLNPPSTILLPHPVTLTPRTRHAFFVPPETFNLFGMLSNPMMLMMIASAGMVFAMPYLMKKMDPETLEEFKAQHAQVQKVMTGGTIKSGVAALTSEANRPPQPVKPQGNKNKRHH